MATVASPAALRNGSIITRLVFALLVVASVAAFFLTTRLKRSTPVVQQLNSSRYLSPNGDGRHDSSEISFRIKQADEVTVTIVNADGDEVRALARDRELSKGRHSFRWNGRVNGGAVASDGEFRVKVGLRHQGRSVTSPRRIFVDTVPPAPIVRYVSPDAISPDGVGGGDRARLRFDGPARVAPRLLVYRTDTPRPRLVARRSGRRGSRELQWDGMVGAAGARRPAAAGNYVMVARVQDAAGNVGPRGLPPVRGRLPGHPGVRVEYLSARGPLGPVASGRQVSFAIAAHGRRYRWRVRRLGSSRTLDHGSSRAPTLRVRAPRGRSGVFLLRLGAGSHDYETPFAVQAKRRGRVLVVLPLTSWQARNPLDSDSDGFADTLPEQQRVTIRRPFGTTGFPSGFAAREAPLLLFLDGDGLRYDITTDVALTAPGARPPIRYGGMLFAGPPRFFSLEAGRLVKSYVDAGGRVAWAGTGGLTQPVKLEKGMLEATPNGRRRNLFGETVRRGPGGPLTVLGDRIEFFAGSGGAFGPFPVDERSERLPAGAALLASAGSEADRPSVSVYRLGKGVVARVGVDGFSREARSSPAVARIMRRLWTLLSR